MIRWPLGAKMDDRLRCMPMFCHHLGKIMATRVLGTQYLLRKCDCSGGAQSIQLRLRMLGLYIQPQHKEGRCASVGATVNVSRHVPKQSKDMQLADLVFSTSAAFRTLPSNE